VIGIGDRVGAISHSKDATLYMFGYGTYAGREVPPADVHFMGLAVNHENPKILLDNGKVVWGCECWWGGEDRVKAAEAKAATVIYLDIEEQRAKWNRANAEAGEKEENGVTG
jgi:hypothetical protein